MPPPLPYFKVNICSLPLPHFASIFFAYLWSFRWPNYYIVTLPRYFSFRLPHLNINTGPPSDELDKNIQRKSHFPFFSHWNGYSHFNATFNNILVISWRSVLLVEETGIPRDNHRPAASHWQTLSHKAVSSTPHLMITTTTVPYQSVNHVSVKNRGECTS
jgi:hypothetical protein